MLKLSLETPKNEAYFTIFNFFNFFFGGEAKRDFVRNKEKSRDVTSSADVDSSLVSTWFILHVLGSREYCRIASKRGQVTKYSQVMKIY